MHEVKVCFRRKLGAEWLHNLVLDINTLKQMPSIREKYKRSTNLSVWALWLLKHNPMELHCMLSEQLAIKINSRTVKNYFQYSLKLICIYFITWCCVNNCWSGNHP